MDGELVLGPVPRDAPYAATAALVGTAKVELEAVGAIPVGNPASADPMRPGVLVFHRTAGDSTSIMLRLGSESNRQDQQPFESAYTVLEVRQASASGFAGSWKSGVTGTVAEGYFCAILTAQAGALHGGFDAGLH